MCSKATSDPAGSQNFIRHTVYTGLFSLRVQFSPFYIGKQLRPVLNSPSDNEGERRGEYFPVYGI